MGAGGGVGERPLSKDWQDIMKSIAPGQGRVFAYDTSVQTDLCRYGLAINRSGDAKSGDVLLYEDLDRLAFDVNREILQHGIGIGNLEITRMFREMPENFIESVRPFRIEAYLEFEKRVLDPQVRS